jgi:hypothetical protein
MDFLVHTTHKSMQLNSNYYNIVFKINLGMYQYQEIKSNGRIYNTWISIK